MKRAPTSTPPPSLDLAALSRRERQIIDVLFRLGKGTAAEILEAVPNPPGYTAIRTHLALLEEKGHVRHETDGTRYIYYPVADRDEMAQKAIDGVLENFFNNSVDLVITALCKRRNVSLTPEQIQNLEALIKQARKEGR